MRQPMVEGQSVKARLLRLCRRLPDRRAVEASSALLIVAVSVDILVVSAITAWVFYLAPIAVMAWVGRRRWAYATVLVAVGLAVLIEMFLTPTGTSGWLTMWNGFSLLLLLGLPTAALTSLSERLGHEERFAAADALTGLPNRGSFTVRLDDELARTGRYGHAFTLAYIDLDGFKAVNDLQGHDTGDDLLRGVAAALRASTRQTDVLGRLGGDEFAVLLPETTFGAGGAVLEKVRTKLLATMKRDDWPVTFSIGAVTFEASVETSREALHVADKAMYEVKRSGKDGIRHLTWDGATALP